MSKARVEALKSLLRLFRFLFWYAVIVASALYLFPLAGQLVERGYEAMSGGARAVSVLAFVALVVAGQLAGMRRRAREPGGHGAGGRTDSP